MAKSKSDLDTWLASASVRKRKARTWQSFPPEVIGELETVRAFNHSGRGRISQRDMLQRLRETHGVTCSRAALYTWAEDTGKPWSP